MLNDYIFSMNSMQWFKIIFFLLCILCFSSKDFCGTGFRINLCFWSQTQSIIFKWFHCFSSSSIIWQECIQNIQRNTGYYRHLSNTATVNYNGDQNSDLLICTCSNLNYCTVFLYYYYVTCTLQLQFIWYLSIISHIYFHTHWNCKVVLNIIKINVWNKRPQLKIQNIKINMIYNRKLLKYD